MKRPVPFAAALFLTFGINAQASPIAFDATFDPANVLMKHNGGVCTGDAAADTVTGLSHSGCVSVSFAYDLDGYDPLIDILSNASLVLSFYDDNSPGPDQAGILPESVSIALDGTSTGGAITILNGSTAGSPFTTLPFNVLAELEDGHLAVFFSWPAGTTGHNDFYFASSRLIADGDREEAPPVTDIALVPEPAALGLFVLGLAAAVRRRRTSSTS
jgi:hypothetical protein